MVPGWKHGVISQSHIDREKNKVLRCHRGGTADVSLQLLVIHRLYNSDG